MRPLAVLVFASLLFADEQTQRMTNRLSEEADAFQKLAPQVLGQETLHQKAQKAPARFRPRIGDAAVRPPPVEWKERDIASEYGFTSLGGALHEMREVVSVDGHKVADTKRAQDALAKVITSTDEARKKEVLKQFEKYGLRGAVTDFGQLILLFTRRELERYEFAAQGKNTLNGTPVAVFTYKQLDGPEALTLIEANRKDLMRRLRIEGEIWVREKDYVPLRITLISKEGEGAFGLREEATVDYSMSQYGALLPVSTAHRELRGGNVVAENHFTYAPFRRFGASSEIKFEVEK